MYADGQSGRYVVCFGCETSAAWKNDGDSPFPVYCAACKDRPTITKEEVLNAHDELKRIRGFLVEGSNIEPSV